MSEERPFKIDLHTHILPADWPDMRERYGEGAEVWPLLREGDPLELVPEPGNAHDLNAVRVEWRGRKLGYVPRRENAALAWGLARGTPLRARVSRLVEHPNPARRIEFEVYIE